MLNHLLDFAYGLGFAAMVFVVVYSFLMIAVSDHWACRVARWTLGTIASLALLQWLGHLLRHP